MGIKDYITNNPPHPGEIGYYEKVGKMFDKSPEAVRSACRYLRAKIKEAGLTDANFYNLINKPVKKPVILKLPKTDTIKLGIVSDTHFGSTKALYDKVTTFYHYAIKQGVQAFLHAGDVVDGFNVYHGQEYELTTFGAQAQADLVINNYPRVNVPTFMITGNHCLSWWKKSGIDIGEIIASKRPDLKYLGQYKGFVEIGGIKIELLHPDGAFGSLSDKAKWIGESKEADLYIVGHYHQQLFYKNVIMCPCFQGQTPFLTRKNMVPDVGGVILTLKIAKGKVWSATPEFINI